MNDISAEPVEVDAFSEYGAASQDLREQRAVEREHQPLSNSHFFYLTNDAASAAAAIVREANQRCNQENLIAQLKTGVRATQMPVDTLVGNWACMVMAALAWTLKAWFALLLPETGRWAERYRREKRAVLRMEFKTFLNAFIRIPAQVVCTGRRIVLRLLTWNPWQAVFLRGVDHLEGCLRC